MTPAKRGHMAAAYRIARQINHGASRKERAATLRSWVGQIKAVLGVA